MRRTIISNTDERSKKRFPSYKYIVEKRREFTGSSSSTSETGTEPVVFEIDMGSVLELSCYRRSTISSRQNSLRGVYDRWFSSEMN